MKVVLTMVIFTTICLWSQALSSYRVEAITPPPTKHDTQQIDGLCFTPDGRLTVCLPSGEIWIRDSKTKTWTLFAESLHTPLGIIPCGNNGFIVTQRPEVTKVQDTDSDGKADQYLCLTDQFGLSGNYHEFNFTPVQDQTGDIFFALGTASNGRGIRPIVRGRFDPRGRIGRMHASVPYRGWVMRLSPDGTLIPWSSGHRTPNGLGFDLAGNLFVTDNQGDWVGTSKLFHVQKGKFYGHAASLNWRKGFTKTALKLPPKELDSYRTRAAVLFPHGKIANSPTQPVVDDTKGKFGPFGGQLLVGEMNHRHIVRVMLERVNGEFQGACTPFLNKLKLPLGSNRMAFAPDGSLYIGHTKHTWAGGKGLSRVIWDKTTPLDILNMNLTHQGFRITFTKPLDRQTALNSTNYSFTRYRYNYHQKYGSKTYETANIPIDLIKLSQNGRTLNVHLKELRTPFIHELNIKHLKASDGSQLSNKLICYTLNNLLPKGTTTWTTPESATKEHPGFRWIGEYQNKKQKLFHQVTLLKNGKYLVTSYQAGLPGRGWDGTKVLSKIYTQKELENLLKSTEPVRYQSPTLGKKAPENATLVMPNGFTNIEDGLLWAGGKSKQEVGSFKMHLEFRLPFKPHRNPSNQDKGNSGIYIFNNYEIQVLDTFALDYSAQNHPIKLESKMTQWCGCLYKMKMADLNMCLPPLTWQTYDIEFTAPKIEQGKKVKNAILTVYHNGVKIHDKVELKSGTGMGARRKQLARGLIFFQNHGNPTAYRNVWIVETDK